MVNNIVNYMSDIIYTLNYDALLSLTTSSKHQSVLMTRGAQGPHLSLQGDMGAVSCCPSQQGSVFSCGCISLSFWSVAQPDSDRVPVDVCEYVCPLVRRMVEVFEIKQQK